MKLLRTILVFLFLISRTTGSSQNWQWDSIATVPGQATSGYIKICKDNFGNIYSYGGSLGGSINKYSVTGTFLWQINLPNTLGVIDLTCSPDSCFYVTGAFVGTLTINTWSLVSKGSSDVFLAKFSSAGLLLWIHQIGSRSSDNVGDLCMSGNSVLITGTAFDTIFYAGQQRVATNCANLFAAKFFSNGTPDTLIVSTPGLLSLIYSIKGVEIEADQLGNIFLIAQIQNGSASIAAGNIDTIGFHLIKLNSNFQYQWRKLISVNNTSSGYHNLRIDSQNNAVIIETIYGQQLNSSIIKYSSAGAQLFSFQYPSTNYINFQVPYISLTGSLGALDLDSCNNIYFTGEIYKTYPTPINWSGIAYLATGQLSPYGTLNWIRKDTMDITPQANNAVMGTGVQSIGLNRVYVVGFYRGTVILKDTLPSTNNYFHAILQTTVGVPINVTPAANLAGCSGHSNTITAQSAGFVQWYTSPFSPSAIGVGSTWITPTLTTGPHTFYAEASTCTMTTGRLPITVTVNPSPTITVNSGSICTSASFTIQASGGNNFIYNPSGPIVTPSASIGYTVSGSAINGCISSAICQVTVAPAPQLSVLSSTNNLCRGQTATLTLNGAQSYSFNLQTSSGSHVVTPSVTSSYLIIGSSEVGCTSSMLYTQNVIDCLSTDLGEQFLKKNFKIYPNPNSGAFFIDVIEPSRVIISDAQGRIILDKLVKENEQITLANNLQGIYFLKIIYSGKEEIRKIIIE